MLDVTISYNSNTMLDQKSYISQLYTCKYRINPAGHNNAILIAECQVICHKFNFYLKFMLQVTFSYNIRSEVIKFL